MAGVVLERYLRAQAHLTIAREQIEQARNLVGKTTLDKKIKKQAALVLKESLTLDVLMQQRMGNIRKEFHNAMDDFELINKI